MPPVPDLKECYCDKAKIKKGNRHYHCPCCDYTGEKYKIKRHLQSKSCIKNKKYCSIRFANRNVERCFCDKFKTPHSHFHCPFCDKIRNRQGFLDHVKRAGCLKRSVLVNKSINSVEVTNS